MKIVCNLLFLLLLFSAQARAADIKFIYKWKAPDAQPVIFKGKKVAVFLVSNDRAGRRAVEEAVAKEITKRGAEGIAASEIVSESDMKDPQIAKARFYEQNVAGILIIRATPQTGEPVDPNMWRDPMYKDVWGFTSRSWNQAQNSQKEDVKFRVEMNVYSLEQEKLIWIGTSEMKSSNLVEYIQGVIDKIAEEMQKDGLIITQQ